MTYTVRPFTKPDLIHVSFHYDRLDEFDGDCFTVDVDDWFDQIRGADEHYIYSGWVMREQTFTVMCLKWTPSKIIRLAF